MLARASCEEAMPSGLVSCRHVLRERFNSYSYSYGPHDGDGRGFHPTLGLKNAVNAPETLGVVPYNSTRKYLGTKGVLVEFGSCGIS